MRAKGQDVRLSIAQKSTIDTTAPPEKRELELLRNVIDPHGIRKLEFLTGPQRNAALREILIKEASH